MRRLKNVGIFIQTILCFVLSRKIISFLYKYLSIYLFIYLFICLFNVETLK